MFCLMFRKQIKVYGEFVLKNIKTCLITFNYSKAFKQPFSNLRKILGEVTCDLYTILGSTELNKIEEKSNFYEIRQLKSKNIFIRLFSYIRMQLKASFLIIKLKRKKSINTCVFFMEDGALLPILISKLINNKTIWILPSNILLTDKDNIILETKILLYIRVLSYYFIDRIIVYSESLIMEWCLEKYINKIFVCSEHFINVNNFKVAKKYNERQKMVGYIGRFSGEKGVFNFIEAIPLIQECDFVVIGDGNLRSKITGYINENNLSEKVRLMGWVSHDELPEYLNKLKLLVLPSYTEGLPNIMLEAMACGTPVLATPVGAIPDVIKDGETGFLLENNSPECIAETALKILHMPDDKLEKVSDNARALVEEKFTFEAAVERWSEIMEGI